jgi:hypothetical protein
MGPSQDRRARAPRVGGSNSNTLLFIITVNRRRPCRARKRAAAGGGSITATPVAIGVAANDNGRRARPAGASERAEQMKRAQQEMLNETSCVQSAARRCDRTLTIAPSYNISAEVSE